MSTQEIESQFAAGRIGVWEYKYQTMPISELREYVVKWESNLELSEHNLSVARGGVPHMVAECEDDYRSTERNLAMVRRILKERES